MNSALSGKPVRFCNADSISRGSMNSLSGAYVVFLPEPELSAIVMTELRKD